MMDLSKIKPDKPHRKKLKSRRQFKAGERIRMRGMSQVYIADKNGTLRKENG